jgi:hypothetical protein
MQNTPVAIDCSNPTGVPFGTSNLRWGAIFAGATAALAIQIVLMMLGAGLGLAMFSPTTSDHAIASFGTGAAVIQGITAVLSLWAGGWVAGRFMRKVGEGSGRLYGFMVWAVATITVVVMLSTGAGWALGSLGKAVGGGFTMAGKPAVDGIAEMAKTTLDKNLALFGSFTEEGMSTPSVGKSPADNLRAKRNLTYSVSKLFTSEASEMAANKQTVIALLLQNQGFPEADATRMVDGWVSYYQVVKADSAAAMLALEKKTKEAAEQSANVLATLSLCYFAAFVLGALAASYGGTHGARYADRCLCKERKILA